MEGYKAWITRLAGLTPRYILTYLPADIEPVLGSTDKDAYVHKGDPLGVGGNTSMCKALLKVCGITREIKELESVRVRFYGEEIL